MLGLLYKDFTAVKGKKFLVFVAAMTLLFVVLRVAFPGTAELEGFMAMDQDGNEVNIIDAFFLVFVLFNVIMAGNWSNMLVGRVVAHDGKNKIRNYLSTLPVGKKAYIISKFSFILAATVFVSLVLYIWCAVLEAFTGVNFTDGLVKLVKDFLPSFFAIVLLLASFELPMNIFWGREKAMIVKVSFLMLCGFFVIGFLLFGDLSVFNRIDIEKVMIWTATHAKGIKLFTRLFPVGVLAMFFGSCFLTSVAYEKKKNLNH